MNFVFNRPAIKIFFDKNALSISQNSFLSDHAGEMLIERLIDFKLCPKQILNLGLRSHKFNQNLRNLYPNSTILHSCFSTELTRLASRNSLHHNQEIFLEADEENLAFNKDSFDLIISLGHLHQVNLLPEMLLQVRNLLKEKSLFIGCFIGEESLKSLRIACLSADEKMGSFSPKVSPFITIKTMAHLLQKTGYFSPITDLDRVTLEYDDLDRFLQELKLMGEGNFLLQKAKNFMSQKRLSLIKEFYPKTSIGKITAEIDLINFMAFKN